MFERYAAEFIMHKDAIRDEYLISFYCTEWDLLIELLDDPKSFFEKQRRDWPADASAASREWRLQPEITAHLKCGYSSQTHFLRLVALAAPKLIHQDVRSVIRKAFGLEEIQSTDPHFADLSRLLDFTESGSFYVEFALYTNSLTIIYYPPFYSINSVGETLYPTKYNPKATTGQPRMLYQGGFTKSTFAYSRIDDDTPQLKTFHFDLADANGKAKFVVNYLENPLGLLDSLNTNFDPAQNNTEFTISEFQTPNNPITVAGPGNANIWRPLELMPGGYGDDQPASADEALFGTLEAMPSMMVTGLSGGPGDPCTQWVLQLSPDGETYQVVEVVVKTY